jgi:hypothetical protein
VALRSNHRSRLSRTAQSLDQRPLPSVPPMTGLQPALHSRSDADGLLGRYPHRFGYGVISSYR